MTFNEIVRVSVSSGVTSSILSDLQGEGELGSRAALSPDGQRVAFEVRKDGETKLFVVDETGAAASLKQVTQTDGNDRFPTWVSATRRGFVSDSGGANNSFEVDVAGGTARLTVPAADQGSYGRAQ